MRKNHLIVIRDDPLREHPVEQGELHRIPLGIDHVDHLVFATTVAGGLDVAAAGKADPVDEFEPAVEVFFPRWQEDGAGTASSNRLDVFRRQEEGPSVVASVGGDSEQCGLHVRGLSSDTLEVAFAIPIADR